MLLTTRLVVTAHSAVSSTLTTTTTIISSKCLSNLVGVSRIGTRCERHNKQYKKWFVWNIAINITILLHMQIDDSQVNSIYNNTSIQFKFDPQYFRQNYTFFFFQRSKIIHSSHTFINLFYLFIILYLQSKLIQHIYNANLP